MAWNALSTGLFSANATTAGTSAVLNAPLILATTATVVKIRGGGVRNQGGWVALSRGVPSIGQT
jgi:hypothetical protein